ncbi:MAG: sulfatase-like hydrolase/transferase [Pirellulales bacterium]
MPTRNVLVVAVDGLRASALGAYGNTMYPTPALDEFAADSFLLDWCYTPTADLGAVYRALWQSMHPARPQTEIAGAASLPRLFSERGYATTLVTDEPQLASFASAADFHERVQLTDSSASDIERAADASHTSLARLFAAACDAVAAGSSTSPRLVWVHSRGMYGPWDAPLDLQRALLDESDPPPVENAAPPDFSTGDTHDPDAAFRYGAAYAAQAMALDASWEGLLEAVQSAGVNQEWLVVLLGARGYPLGEHRRIGGDDPRLYAEQLHVPWLMRFPDSRGRLARSGQLASPLDLLPTLMEWIGGADHAPTKLDGLSVLPLIGSARPAWRESLIAVSAAGHRAIRTAEWSLRQDAAAQQQPELYVRPDDRWEFNDVAKLCPEVLETLTRAMDEHFPQK